MRDRGGERGKGGQYGGGFPQQQHRGAPEEKVARGGGAAVSSRRASRLRVRASAARPRLEDWNLATLSLRRVRVRVGVRVWSRQCRGGGRVQSGAELRASQSARVPFPRWLPVYGDGLDARRQCNASRLTLVWSHCRKQDADKMKESFVLHASSTELLSMFRCCAFDSAHAPACVLHSGRAPAGGAMASSTAYILALCRCPNPCLPYCLRLLCALCILGQWARNPLLLPSSHLWTTFTQATKSSDVDWGSQ